MAWIESHDDIWEHHKTIRLCRILGILDVEAVGHLLSLWHFVLRNAWRDANLEAWGDDGIEHAARWRREPGALVKALREVGYLDGSVVHGWSERAGRLVYDRARKEEGRHQTLAQRTAADKLRTIGGLSEATVPNPTLPNRTKQPTEGEEAAFEAFWKLYPRKTAKAAAFKAWKKVAPDAVLLARIEAAVRAQALCEQWTKDGGQFIPYPATWLNQGRWADELQARGSSNGRIVGAAAPTPGKFAHLGEKNG